MTTITPAQFDALPDREVDALIAEKVMGWRWKRNGLDGSTQFLFEPKQKFTGPHYSTDLNACHEMEEQILLPRNYGLYGKYCAFLAFISHGYKSHQSVAMKKVIHATARQKCKAALMAVGVITEAAKEGGRE